MFLKAKKLSQYTLDTVSVRRCTDFLAHDNAQPVKLLLIWLSENNEILRIKLSSCLHHPLEILRMRQSLPSRESKRSLGIDHLHEF